MSPDPGPDDGRFGRLPGRRFTRRRLLGALAGGAVAGCLGAPAADGTPTAGTRSGSDGGSDPSAGDGEAGTAVPLARHGRPQSICEEEVESFTGIYAVDDPAFDDDWEGYDVGGGYRLRDDETVVGLTAGDRARAYPLSVLYHHEIVNDEFGPGRPVMVTYCPLCSSGMVADRRVDGQALEFRVSGLLWQPPGLRTAAAKRGNRTFGAKLGDPDADLQNTGNLVMYDVQTRSYWSQILATAICGSHRGTELRIVPSTTATWGEWQERYPGTDVLLPPPHSGTVAP